MRPKTIHKESDRTILVWSVVLWLVFGVAVWRVNSGAQPSLGGRAKGFTFPYKDEQGRETKVRGNAETLPGGRIEFKPGTIETYRGEEKDMIIEAPQCILDTKTGVVTSSGALSVRTTDERLSIQGKGFRWQLSDSHLQISNEVHTVIRTRSGNLQSPLLAPATNTNLVQGVPANPGNVSTNSAAPKPETFDILSSEFDFSSAGAVFRGAVRAKQEAGLLSCGLLRASFEPSGGGLARIDAEENVLFEQNDTQMAGEKAVYLPSDGAITLTGRPSWKVRANAGSGDVIRINNTTREFRVERNVLVKLAPDSALTLDWLSRATPTNAAAPKRPPMEIRADDLDYRADSAVFRGFVRVSDGQGGMLTCGVLTNKFSGPNGKLVEAIAQDSVELKQGKTGAKASRAWYQATNELVILTGNPTWTMEIGDGRSETLTIDPKSRQMFAEGNVAVKLHNIATNALDFALPMATARTNSTAGKDFDLEIFAGLLRYKPGSAIFLKGVRVTSPQESDQELTCEVLAAFFADQTNKLDELVAEDNVTIRQGRLHASGQKAVYFVPRGLVELRSDARTGSPRLEVDGQIYAADLLILDRSNRTFRMKGHYRIEMERRAARELVRPAPKQ